MQRARTAFSIYLSYANIDTRHWEINISWGFSSNTEENTIPRKEYLSDSLSRSCTIVIAVNWSWYDSGSKEERQVKLNDIKWTYCTYIRETWHRQKRRDIKCSNETNMYELYVYANTYCELSSSLLPFQILRSITTAQFGIHFKI